MKQYTGGFYYCWYVIPCLNYTWNVRCLIIVCLGARSAEVELGSTRLELYYYVGC